ncbi:hypothetical protein E2C01_063574 [Portunus trituberculatus]|uniref:Uncharacterized protein n=1 Tax=Portunus trituberculatus TaxID=210409 RepID=A0A5B7H9I3_PORTR|nr:hypothetical protein [Portunus trituberculatus]
MGAKQQSPTHHPHPHPRLYTIHLNPLNPAARNSSNLACRTLITAPITSTINQIPAIICDISAWAKLDGGAAAAERDTDSGVVRRGLAWLGGAARRSHSQSSSHC